jgi:hypothetical protein
MRPDSQSVPSPDINPETAPIWKAAARGELALGYCASCAKYHHYPRSLCPFCHSERTELRMSQGKGTLYSFSTLHRVAEPYTLAWVTLEEGPSLLTNIVDADPATLNIGQNVHVVFIASENGTPVPMFTTASK